MPPSHKDPAAAFWAKVSKHGPGGCWIWLGSKPNGYGQLRWAGRNAKAHRIAWMLLRGPIPGGLFVLHNCPGGDNPSCVNPGHMFLGTQAQNMADAANKGRMRSWATTASVEERKKLGQRGERNGRAKMTLATVRDLRAAYANGERQIDLAARFGIAQTTVSKIVRREHWRDCA